MLKLKLSVTVEESNNKVSVIGLILSGFMHEYKLGLQDFCYFFFKNLHSRFKVKISLQIPKVTGTELPDTFYCYSH